MDTYLNIILDRYLLPFGEQVLSLSPGGWAIVSAILFGTVVMMRSLRMVRRADADARPENVETRVQPVPRPTRPKRVTRNVQQDPQVAEASVVDDHQSVRRAPRPAPVRSAQVQPRQMPNLAAKPEEQRPVGKKSLTPGEVAEALNSVRFDGISLMKWQEYCLLRDIEGLLERLGSGHRLFCHVALREFFEPSNNKHSPALRNAVASAIAPYRADFLIVDRQGYPAMGIGFGKTDPVVRTVFVQAQLPCLTVQADYDWMELEPELVQLLGATPRSMRKSA